MAQLINSLSSLVGITVVVVIIILFILTLLTPLFIYLISKNVKQLLHEQRIANEEIVKNLDKISERLKKITSTLSKKKIKLLQAEKTDNSERLNSKSKDDLSRL